MTTNPDTMVALTAALLSGKVSTRAGDICSSIVSSNPTSGLNHAVLDALAGLCVCEPESEAIAIGYRCKKPNAELIIASNNGPPPDLTLKHLQNIWELLLDLSATNPSVNQFDMTHNLGDPSFHKLFIDVYKHSFKVAQSAMRSIGLLCKHSENSTAIGSHVQDPRFAMGKL